MMPHRTTDPAQLATVLGLMRAAFAFMDGRIDPPSSLQALTPDTLAQAGEVWVIGRPPRACMVLTPKPHALYIGRLAVDRAARGQGLARRLVAQADDRALALHLPVLELLARVELVENHAVFRALGFAETARTTHPGFDRPTSITFQRPVKWADSSPQA